jgi:hypothetical protein
VDEWPPPEARLTAILWRVEGHLERGEFLAAASALDEGDGLGEDELLAGLRHLAAAGYRAQTDESARARRQLAHARRRLAPFLPEHRGLDVAALVAMVAVFVESDGD